MEGDLTIIDKEWQHVCILEWQSTKSHALERILREELWLSGCGPLPRYWECQDTQDYSEEICTSCDRYHL